MKKVRITVLCKQLYKDLAEEYLTDGADVECDFYRVGQTFLYEGGAEMPPGFCPWAWVNIYHPVSALSGGATCTPWQKREHMNVVCCPDGIRPVTFLLEAEEQANLSAPAPPGAHP